MPAAKLSPFSAKLLSIHTRKSATPCDDPGLESKEIPTVPVVFVEDTGTQQYTDTAHEYYTISAIPELLSVEPESDNGEADVIAITNVEDVPTIRSLCITMRGEVDDILSRLCRIEDTVHVNVDPAVK